MAFTTSASCALRRALVLCVFSIAFAAAAQAAYLRNIPQTITQPDGQTIECFASGDEFFNWIHDAAGRVIIQDDSGFWTYARKIDGALAPSSHVVGRVDAEALGIKPGLQPDQDLLRQTRMRARDFMAQAPPRPAPTSGTINNLVIFIRFSDDTEFSRTLSSYDTMLNDTAVGANSMNNYFQEVSYGDLTVQSSFYPQGGTMVVSYQDTQPRAYFQPYNATTNPSGYNGDDQRTEREQSMLERAINAISGSVSGIELDGDNDGDVDSVNFIVRGSPDGWSDLLWPHKWSLYTKNVTINGDRVYEYAFQLETSLDFSGVGVLCHEMFHVLGAPDLYHYYERKDVNPVYKWDLMEYNQNPPQHMMAYMKYRYGKWIDSIPEITSSGTYTLNPLTSSDNNCYKIASPYTTSEYFMVEYRRQTGTFESSLPGSGLIVYRINTAADGDGNRDLPDEVYIYRPNGTNTVNGDPDSAYFSSESGRTTITSATSPNGFLSSNADGGLNISSVGSAGDAISFTVTLEEQSDSLTITSPNGGEKWETGSTQTITWNSSGDAGSTVSLELYNLGSLDRTIAASTDNDGSYDWTIPGDVTPSGNYKVKITSLSNAAVTDQSDSSFSIQAPVESGPDLFFLSYTVSSYQVTEGETFQVSVNEINQGSSQAGASKTALYLTDELGNLDNAWKSDLADVPALNPSETYSPSWSFSFPNLGSGTYTVWLYFEADTEGDVPEEDEENLAYGVNPISVTSTTSPTAITVLSPNGGESATAGETMDIEWVSQGYVGDQVNVSLYKGGSLESSIAANLKDTGTYSWTVPSGLADGDDYTVRVESALDSDVYDDSDAAFSIAGGGAIASITVTSPNGGETWQLGSAQTIQWTSQGLVGSSVSIELYKSGASHLVLAASTDDDGAFAWTVSKALAPASDYTIRIMSLDDATVYDDSDGWFSLSSGSEPQEGASVAPVVKLLLLQ